MKKEIYEGLLPYIDEIKETLDWMKDGKSSLEFDEWMRFYNCEVEIITENKVIDGVKYTVGDKIVSPKPEKFKASYIDPKAFVLGSFEQGIGVDTWAGRLDLVQILMSEGYIETYTKDDVIYYKTIKQFEEDMT